MYKCRHRQGKCCGHFCFTITRGLLEGRLFNASRTSVSPTRPASHTHPHLARRALRPLLGPDRRRLRTRLREGAHKTVRCHRRPKGTPLHSRRRGPRWSSRPSISAIHRCHRTSSRTAPSCDLFVTNSEFAPNSLYGHGVRHVYGVISANQKKNWRSVIEIGRGCIARMTWSARLHAAGITRYR